jgi:hypothetical protein
MFEDFMFYLTTILIFCGGFGAATFLVHDGHPWFALLILLLTASVQLRSRKHEVRKEQK